MPASPPVAGSGRTLDVAVVGAGFAGLAAAYDLAGAGHRVTVYDAQRAPGGLAAGFRDPGWEWALEHFYHHVFLSDRAILGLAREIGFGDRILTLRPVSAQRFGDRTLPLDGILPILRFPLLPPLDRLRMGAVGGWLKLTRDWHRLEHVAAHDWVPRWMGRRAYALIWEPLLIGKFGRERYRRIPMSWLWARLHARTFRLGYFAGGFQALADALMAAGAARGAVFRLGTPVGRIGRTAGEGGAPWQVDVPGGPVRHDRVVFTSAPHLLARAAPELPPDYLGGLAQLEHLGAIVAVLALDRPLMERTYWLNLDKREFPFLAAVEHTNLVPPERYGGDHLVYLGDYLPTDAPLFAADDDGVLDAWLPAVARINPAFDRRWIRRSWVFRAPYAQPVVSLGFSSRIPALATPLPGLYLASMSQVYPWDRGTNFAVAIGREVAALVADSSD